MPRFFSSPIINRTPGRKTKNTVKRATIQFETLEERTVPAISITTGGVPLTQNFDTLVNTGTSSSTPTDWVFSESGSGLNTTYTAGNGGGTGGDTYSFGTTGSTERAFGGLQSGSVVPTIGASFTNNTGASIVSLAIAYQGEQWRLGAISRTDRLDFQYSLNATSLTTGTWVDVNALDFSSPFTTTVGALDGNAVANKTAISSTIGSLSISDGSTFWIRWSDFNATGSDDGLAVDDFSLTATVAAGATTTTTLDTITSPVTWGQNVNFAGTVVNQTDATTPVGTIEIRNGGPSGTLLASTTTIGGSGANGTFSIDTTTVPVGTYSNLAAYFIPGSGSFNASNGAGPSLTVNNVAFTAGNIAVLQTSEADTNSPFSIIEVNSSTPNQTSVNSVPINGTTGDNALRLSGTTATNGYLSTTNYGQYLVFTGSNITTDIGDASANGPRGVGILDSTGSFTQPLPAAYLGVVSDLTRGATSVDNSTFFITDSGGIYTNNATSPALAGTASYRAAKSFGGTVYIGNRSTTGTDIQVSTLSAPNAGGTITGLPGLTNNSTFQDFYLIQSGDNGAAYDVLYIVANSNATTGVISKYSLVSGTWTANGTYATTFGGFSLAAADNGSGASLYVTTGTGGAVGGSLLKLSDTAGYNATISISTPSNVTLYTATGTKILKGVAFTPQNVTVSAPTVTTPTVSTITFSSATLGGTVTADGNSLITERGVIYVPTTQADADPVYGENGVLKQVATGTIGTFTVGVTSLTAGINYTYLAYATNASGTSYSPIGTFDTLASALPPSITSPTVSGVTDVAATLGGTVTSDGGDPITERGVIYVTAALGDADPIFGETGVLKQIAAGTGISAFTVGVTGLSPSTEYKYRAYATNNTGTTYTTSVGSFTTTATPTAPIISTPTATAISTTNATLGGNVTADGGSAVTARGIVYSLTSVDATPQLGESGVSSKVVSGTTGTFSSLIQGLLPHSTYSYAAYATNAAGTSYTTFGTFTTSSIGLLISEYLANPTGNDASQEYVELVATRTIDFSQTPYSVVFTNNQTATANGWIQGASISYGFNITSGIVNAGDVVYVGGSAMAPTGTKIRTIDISTTAGDSFGSIGGTAGVLGNGGAAADSIGVFDVGSANLTNSTPPIDTIFYGGSLGTAVVNAGADGYQLPVSDLYAGGKLQTSSFFALDTANGTPTIATGSFNPVTNTFPTTRTWANATATATSAVALISATTTALTSVSPLNVTVGASVAFAGTVVASLGTATPTGTIEIRDGGPTGTLLASTSTITGPGVNGTFSFSSTAVPAGAYNDIHAYYVATGAFSNSNSAAFGSTLTVNALSAPTVTSLTPVIGPTTGGTLVTILGSNFVSISSVTFDGAAVSFSVVSATEISATTASHGVGGVDVVVTNPAGSGSVAGASDFTFAAAPSVASVVVNGGPNVTLGATNVTMSLAGQHSVVKQILVTFQQAVTVASDAFTVTPVPVNPSGGAGFVKVNGGASPSTNAATTSVTMLTASTYLVTFVDDSADPTPSTHGGGVLNSGVYDLTTIASKVTANGLTMAANRTDTFFALFGNVEANNTYDTFPVTQPVPQAGYSSGDGKTGAFVDPGSLFQFSDAFGSSATAPVGPPAYNIVFDANLDGAIDPGDLFAFSDAFGIDWSF